VHGGFDSNRDQDHIEVSSYQCIYWLSR